MTGDGGSKTPYVITGKAGGTNACCPVPVVLCDDNGPLLAHYAGTPGAKTAALTGYTTLKGEAYTPVGEVGVCGCEEESQAEDCPTERDVELCDHGKPVEVTIPDAVGDWQMSGAVAVSEASDGSGPLYRFKEGTGPSDGVVTLGPFPAAGGLKSTWTVACGHRCVDGKPAGGVFHVELLLDGKEIDPDSGARHLVRTVDTCRVDGDVLRGIDQETFEFTPPRDGMVTLRVVDRNDTNLHESFADNRSNLFRSLGVKTWQRTVTRFTRTIITECDGTERPKPGSDTRDGKPYTVTGEVGPCPREGARP